MNKNNKIIAITSGLILSSSMTHAASNYSEYFAYDVSGVKVEDASAPATQHSSASGTTSQGYQAEIIYMDEADSKNSSGYQAEIIYEDQVTANTPAIKQAEIVYEDTPIQETTQATQAAIQQAPAAPGGSSYAIYADTSDSHNSAPAQTTAAVTSQVHQPRVKAVSRYEIDQAINAGRVDLVDALHKRGADLLSPGHQGMTHLHKAAAAGKLRLVKYLIKIGASPDEKTTKNWTPLHHAARFGHASVVSYLLSAGADKHQKTSDGFSPAQLAMNVQQVKIAGLLQ